MTERFDFAVFGSGFSGSIMSMVLRRLGYSVLLVESGSHPRFVIGESSTPLANLLLEKLADSYALPGLRPFSKWGSWQAHHPEVACGLKRGFTFFHHHPGRSLDLADPATQLLIAASPNDQVADTHWYRPDFDLFLVNTARKEGVKYVDRAALARLERAESWNITLQREGERIPIEARFLLDAGGPFGDLANSLGIARNPLPEFPETRAIYAHFRNVPPLGREAATVNPPPWPYPPEDAAVHHVFDGGWIWMLRFNNGITSAGAALSAGKAKEIGLDAVAPKEAWENLLSNLPSLREQFGSAEPASRFHTSRGLAFGRARATGEGWALMPSAAGFVDPLLSTGFALTLLGILRLGQVFAEEPANWPPGLAAYEESTFSELEAASDLVSALYGKMSDPEQFGSLALIYFAALSFTESCWRLGKDKRARGFLLAADPGFSAARREICRRARSGLPITRGEVLRAIAPYDVAGLSDPTRHPWYPARVEDLFRDRNKLGASELEIQEMLEACGLKAKS